jgi:hypothetical protein
MPFRGKKDKSSMPLFAQSKSGMPLGLKLSIVATVAGLGQKILLCDPIDLHRSLAQFSYLIMVGGAFLAISEGLRAVPPISNRFSTFF